MLRKILLFALLNHFLLLPYMGFSQQTKPELQFKGRWDNDLLRKTGTQTFSSLWGWVAPDAREYAIIGSLDSIYFIDVTDPEKPVLRDAEAGRYNFCEHREFKTYKNYCYAVADEGASSLQIFDLKYLPDSVHKVYDSDTLSTRAHNLFIDNNKLYLADNKIVIRKENLPPSINFFTLTVASLENPEAPEMLGFLEPAKVNGEYIHGVVHDLFVRNDTAYCSNKYDGLFIYNYKDVKNPKLIASIQPPYPDNGMNHSNWLSTDGNTMVFADETHAKRIKIYDVSSLKTSRPDNLEYISSFGSSIEQGSLAHNPFIKNNLVYTSYYHDGVVVFDISNRNNVKKIAQYDTYPQNDTMKDVSKRYDGFEGCWNVYPFLPSGNIIASDMTNGLFVLWLDTVPVTSVPIVKENTNNIQVLSNPFREEIRIKTHNSKSQQWYFRLSDVAGHIYYFQKMVLPSGDAEIRLPLNKNLPKGMYFLHVQNEQNSSIFKLIHL